MIIITIEDLHRRFPDERACMDYLLKYAGNCCRFCKSSDLYYTPYREKYKCKRCTRQFTPAKGTIFESTQLPMIKWFIAIYLTSSYPKGLSSYQIAKHLKISERSAWHMLHKIRQVSKPLNVPIKREPGIIEIEE